MRYHFILFFILFAYAKSFTQIIDSKRQFNTKFRIALDSIERKLIVNKFGTDSSYLLYYTITNISKDTLTYITNSCFYYNHYSLKVEEIEFDLNPKGGCIFNETTSHLLPPGGFFKKTEFITAFNLHALTKGERNVTLLIPLIQDNEIQYRVDGRVFDENVEYLIFDNQAKIVETILNKRKRN